jgi:hypothetical protein
VALVNGPEGLRLPKTDSRLEEVEGISRNNRLNFVDMKGGADINWCVTIGF